MLLWMVAACMLQLDTIIGIIEKLGTYYVTDDTIVLLENSEAELFN